MSSKKPFSRLVGLLEQESPNAIAELRKRYPAEAQTSLSSVAIFGDKPDDTSANGSQQHLYADRQKHAALSDLLRLALHEVRESLDKVLQEMRARMKLVNRINFGGALVATLAGVLGPALVYFGGGDKQVALAAALIAAVGGLAAITSDYFARAPSGVRLAGGEEYGRTLQMRAEVERMNRLHQRDIAIAIQDEEISKYLKVLDEYAAHVVKLVYA